jgi:hypothetical protein
MAGAGYKLFATGDVLTAAQVNTYLNEQTVMVFADSAARTTALSGVLAEGMMSYLQDTDSVEVYDGTSWTAVGGGGMTNPMTTTGDVIYSSSGSTPARLGIGTASQVLAVNSGATAPEWVTPAAGGGWTLISTSEPSGATAVDFTSISNTYTQLVVTWAGIYAASNNSNFLIRLNSDSSTAYKERSVEFSGASTVGNYLGVTTSIPCMVRTTSTTETETAAGYMIIFNANSTTLNKYIESVTSYKRADTATDVIRRGSYHYDSNSAISSINFFRGETAGTISVTSGGFIQLWGLK